MDERRAIERLKAGDIGGLADLVRRYQTSAIETAYLITQDLALAEDVVQDVFLQVYRSIEHFDLTRPFKPWLMRSTVNAAVRAVRRQQADLSLDSFTPGSDGQTTLADLLPDQAPGPEAHTEMAEIEAAVEAALRRLPPEQRAAIVLRYFLDFSDEEMAVQLNCAPGTVRWRLHTARKQLGVMLRRLVTLLV